MSWLSDLAGKAENMLIKLDQNAATVLQQQTNLPTDETTNLIEITTQNDAKSDDIVKPLRRNYSGSSLSLTRPNTSSPQRAMKLNGDATDSPAHSSKGLTSLYSNVSEKVLTSSSNSRRSSLSSKANGTVVEKDMDSMKTTDNVVAMDFSVERELSATKIVLAEVKSERDELKCEVESLTEQIKISNSQARVKELEDSYAELIVKRDELLEKYMSLEISNTKYVKSISELETVISKLHQNEVELTERLEMSRKETEHAVSNLQQYRSRAQATLQLKEQLIEQLKTGGVDSAESSNSNAHQIDVFEMEQLKTENSHYLEENRLLSEQLDSAKSFIQKMEINQKQYEATMESQAKSLKESLSEEQKRSQTFEDDLKALTQELAVVREETTRQHAVYSQKLHEQEVEMSKLRTRISQRPAAGETNSLEQRIQSLTQSLVQKQTSLETATAECNALRLQFEKIESQHRSTVMQLRQQRPQFVSVNDTDDAKARVPNFMQEHPFDTGVARRVKRAYSSVDSFGIRFGVFLRRYPLIRIIVLGYVAFLHLWVIFVLLSSTPN